MFLLMFAAAMVLQAQGTKVRVIAFGAHPDDCDIRASGTAALFASMGQAVKFVSVTNGDAGHQSMKGPALAARRREEASESARRLGISYAVFCLKNKKLLSKLHVR